MKGKVKRNAFTLVEVIIALALFAISILLLSQSFVNGLLCKHIFFKEDQWQIIYPTLRNIILNQSNPEILVRGGSFFTPKGTKIDWTAQASPGKVCDLYSIKAKCRYNGEDNDPLVHEVFYYVYQPKWTKEKERERLLESRQVASEEITANEVE